MAGAEIRKQQVDFGRNTYFSICFVTMALPTPVSFLQFPGMVMARGDSEASGPQDCNPRCSGSETGEPRLRPPSPPVYFTARPWCERSHFFRRYLVYAVLLDLTLFGKAVGNEWSSIVKFSEEARHAMVLLNCQWLPIATISQGRPRQHCHPEG